MSSDCAISLNGIFAAEENFSQSARRIAAGNLPDPADMIAANQAKTAVDANLQVISTQQEIDGKTLDLFA
jgi:flagellar basal body rod protein FlgC